MIYKIKLVFFDVVFLIRFIYAACCWGTMEMEHLLRALIVDDAELSRRVLKRVVSEVFEYDEAENGLIAVRKYIESLELGKPYDIIFMDIVMPELDGKKAVKIIRKIERYLEVEQTPIVMISASEMLDEIEELVSGLLRKVVNRQLLNETLRGIFKDRIVQLRCN